MYPRQCVKNMRNYNHRQTDGKFSRFLDHNNTYFSKITTAIQAYWLGFLMGDGWIQAARPDMGCESKDHEHMHKLKMEIGGSSRELKLIAARNQSSSSTTKFGIYDEQLVSDLINLGLIAGKGKSKGCEVQLEKIPKQFHRDFWRGLFDADGSLMPYVAKEKSRKGGQSRIELKGSKSNIDLFIDEIRRFGFKGKAQNKPIISKIGDEIGTQWLVATQGDPICKKIIGWLYSNPCESLDRKQVQAEIIMSKEIIHHKFDHLFADGGDQKLKMEHGTWQGVADFLGMSLQYVKNARKRARS